MKLKSASLPYAVWSFIFVVVPLGMVAYFAFIDQNGHSENSPRILLPVPTSLPALP